MVQTSPITLAVLVSGGGSTLGNLIQQIDSGALNARIGVVIASKPDIFALQRAADAQLLNFVVERTQFDSIEEFSRQVFSLCEDAGANLVCMAGWLALVEIPHRYAGRVMNIHPSLLPSFGGKGMYGARVHKAVLEHGVKVSGCTVHVVDASYDEGPIILQRAVTVEEQDTPTTLAARVAAQENIAYPAAIRLYQENLLTIDGRCVRIAEQPAAL